MRLIQSLTTLSALALSAALLAGCAGNTPRKPAATDSKGADTPFGDRCIDAESRGAIPPAGCPDTGYRRRAPARTGPQIDPDALPLPTLPGGGLSGNPLRR